MPPPKKVANYQRQRAQIELIDVISEQVKIAIDRNLDQPEFFPETSGPGRE